MLSGSKASQVPGKPRLLVSHTQMNTALIQWHPPVETFGPVLGYRLKFGRKDSEVLTTLEFSERDDHYTAMDIHKGTSYVFKLSSKNKVGFGEEIVKEITIPEERPSGFPQNSRAGSSTASTIQLSWHPPVLAERNGFIMKYNVLYRDINSPNNRIELSVFSPETSLKLTNLKPDTTYDIKVRAHTSKGPGPYSPSVQFRTLPLDPAVFAKNFHVKAVMKTSVLLTWEIPENYNTAIPFKIIYNNDHIEVDGRATQKLITNLDPDTSYSFVLTNRGNSAGGLQQVVSAHTAPDLLRTKPVLIEKTNSDGMLTVELSAVPTPPAPVKGYYIIVVPLKKSRGKFVKPWDSPDEMDLEELLREITRKRRSIRLRRHADALKPYIAAHFEVLPNEFTLGDRLFYNGFENKRLQSGQEYVFFILAVLDSPESMMYATSPYSDPVLSADLDPQPITDEEEGLIWVVGPVLAVVFIICIVIAILLYKRKRTESDSRKSSIPNSKELPSHHPTDPVELRRLNFQTPGMTNHPPIPISELADHIERLKANDNLKFSQEYESVDPGQQFTWEHSNMEVNKPKNRYANVIAYDHSRVLLSAID
ncbi:hypothetical protein scyTo_0015983, partial [Scyliorhinus torazame]|nr:hypothetical protein [Scyliorhinus torazame]